jgi:hypothetical protein
MCDPITATLAGASVLQGYGSYQQGKAQAANELDAASAEASKIRTAGERQRGSARVALAASGVQLDTGSAALAEADITNGYQQDAMMAFLGGQRRAASAKQAGKNALVGSLISAGATVAGGWKSTANGWDAKGFTGTNDRGLLSKGNNVDWFLTNGSGGD